MLGGGSSEKHWMLIAGGQVIETVLTNEIVCVQVAVWPAWSVAVHVRVMMGPAQFAPVVWSLWATVTGPHESDATGLPVTPGAVDEPQGMTAAGGHWIVGGVVSTTDSVRSHDFCTPPGKFRKTLTTTEPGFDVVTVTEQERALLQVLGPTKDAPAVLLASIHVALNGP
jgi:hypothetical protein